jgi:predicted Rossmann-fold nucleotide-binding protein
MEVVTWNQLGIHDRGIVVLNVGGFWDGIVEWVLNAAEAGFVKGGNADIMLEAKSAEEVVKILREYRVSEGRFGLDWDKS